MAIYDIDHIINATQEELQVEDHKRLSKQGRIQLELMIEYGIERYIDKYFKDKFDELKNMFNEAISYARQMCPDVREDNELSPVEINKYVKTYIEKLGHIVEEHNIAEQIGPKIKAR